LIVLKRDGNLLKTKTRLAYDIRVDAAVQDTMTSKVENGKATITTTLIWPRRRNIKNVRY
jgi:hypothetical protein